MALRPSLVGSKHVVDQLRLIRGHAHRTRHLPVPSHGGIAAQQLGAFQVALGPHQRSSASFGIGTAGQQKPDGLRVAVKGRQVQGSRPPICPRVDASSELQQKLDGLQPPSDG